MKRLLRPTAGWLLLLACASVHATTMCHNYRSIHYGKSEVAKRFNQLDQEYRDAMDKALAMDYAGGNVCSPPRGDIQEIYCQKYWSGALPEGRFYTSFASRMMWNAVPAPDLGMYWPEMRGIKGYTVRAQKWFDIFIYTNWVSPGARVEGRVDGGVNPSMPGEMIGACWDTKSYIAYMNGVFTTPTEAGDGLSALRAEFGSMYDNTPLEYQMMHNQTACDGQSGRSCLGDLAEVFAQRQSLLNASLANRWEVFWDIVGGRESTHGSSTNGLREGLGNLFTEFVTDMAGAIRNKALKSLVAMFAKRPADEDGEKFLAQLVRNAEDNRSATLVVAHSQGNLFTKELKAKYEAYMKRKSSNPIPPVTFVHAAPPTKSLAGPYALADIDLVIRGLDSLTDGSTPMTNVTVPFSTSDVLGHGFVETYWDKSRPAFGLMRRLITDSLNRH